MKHVLPKFARPTRPALLVLVLLAAVAAALARSGL
jgi:hypothetical protein